MSNITTPKNSKHFLKNILPKSDTSVTTNKLITGTILVLTMAALLLALDIKQGVDHNHKKIEASPASIQLKNNDTNFRERG